ncbi:hypothetical protein GA565_24005 [Rouxiella sp. S1S-2]|uniref:LysE family translocator n=1 Tax=Rouxiella sp. S1S-2 TaxID=2653856 RepID=UPI001264EDF8|nr:LysE family transporter [Rouxiella sp. S1S-2]KAB7893395.1 hypothetical protein GA565_24005 [Rouxiella sp. S1S-2]
MLGRFLTITGAGYLFWLGVGILRNPSVPVIDRDGEEFGSRVKWALKGFCINGLNLKVFLLFLALLPQFTNVKSAWPLPLQMTALGLSYVFSCGVIVGYCSSAALQTCPQAAKMGVG